MKTFLIIGFLASFVSIGAVQQDPNHEIKVEKAKQVVIQAQRDWPGDYRMQIYQIDTQIKALEQMDKICESINLK